MYIFRRYINGMTLDDRPVRADFDWGFKEGRQFGRGRSGGQVCACSSLGSAELEAIPHEVLKRQYLSNLCLRLRCKVPVVPNDDCL